MKNSLISKQPHRFRGQSKIIAAFFAVFAICFLPEIASAAGCGSAAGAGFSFGGGWGASLGSCKDDPIGDMFRFTTQYMTGLTGKALCTIAILIAGVGALFGRVSWIRALTIAVGVALVFGAITVVHMASGGADQGVKVVNSTGQCDDPLTLLGTAGLPLNHICDSLRTIINTIASSTGQGIATLAVLILGLSALFGRLTPAQAIVSALGIALVFGAVNIVNILWDHGNLNSDCIVSAIAKIGRAELVLCRFLQELRGDSARFMGTIAVMSLGFLAMIGRLSWQFAIVCFVGIATVYGSDAILNLIAPAAAEDCNTLVGATWGVGLGAIEGVMCSIVRFISGAAGKALASSAIVMLGFGAMMGKINYTSALTVAIGTAIAFGSPHLVFILTGIIDSCALSLTVGASANVCTLIAR